MTRLLGWSSLVLVLGAGAGLDAGQGSVTGVSLSPAAAEAGATVTATATGSSPCGAVHINWGDGEAITYATETLPVSKPHVYRHGGTYTVRAQGMGNCSGEASTRITITGPAAPPPPPAAALTGIRLSQTRIQPKGAVNITLQGTGECRATVDFGDGNQQDVRGALPNTIRHTYALPGRYVIVATPAPPCAERRSVELDVVETQVSRLTDVTVDANGIVSPGLRTITVSGSGPCAYTVDYGDGNTETREATLPETLRHNYPATGRYTVSVTARQPCTGQARAMFEAAVTTEQRPRIERLVLESPPARAGRAATFRIEGTGTCRLVVDFDDGETLNATVQLPYRFTHRFSAPGNYEVLAWPHEPCTGSSDLVVTVRR